MQHRPSRRRPDNRTPCSDIAYRSGNGERGVRVEAIVSTRHAWWRGHAVAGADQRHRGCCAGDHRRDSRQILSRPRASGARPAAWSALADHSTAYRPRAHDRRNDVRDIDIRAALQRQRSVAGPRAGREDCGGARQCPAVPRRTTGDRGAHTGGDRTEAGNGAGRSRERIQVPVPCRSQPRASYAADPRDDRS